jgi:hypothetical protein
MIDRFYRERATGSMPKAIIEPDRPLTSAEVVERICGYYGRERLEPIARQGT